MVFLTLIKFHTKHIFSFWINMRGIYFDTDLDLLKKTSVQIFWKKSILFCV